jgi:membrane fusion protein (multidrug efflux system)
MPNVAAPLKTFSRRYGTPLLIALLAFAIVVTLTRNWNAWEGEKIEQVTNDAYVRRDLTPLSTKIAGLVRAVNVGDYQHVRKGDELVVLEDDDYRAQVAQAAAAVEAAKAALENNRRQRELQDTKTERALAVIDEAYAQIAAAQAGKATVEADVTRTQSERVRQEALFDARSTTQQKVESAVADEERFTAQASGRDADLAQARTVLRSNELAAETERRTKAVLGSQGAQLLADLHAREAALAGAQISLGYTRIVAPADGTVGERQVRPGQLVSPGVQVMSFVDGATWVQANFREIRDEPSDLVRISDTFFRTCVREPRPTRFVLRSHVRRRRTRLDVDDRDLLLRKVEGETLHEPGNRRFRHSVDGCARDDRAARHVAADDDHLATGRQMTSGSLRCDKDAPYVDRDHLVKVGKRVVGYVPVDQDARVVYEDIQPAECFCGAIDGNVERLCIGAVGVQRGGMSTCIFDTRRKRLGGRPTTHVGERHRGALACETPHDSGADAA